MKQQSVWSKVADTAGFYNEFTVMEVVEWTGLTPQQVRDVCRWLMRKGMLSSTRSKHATYRWTEDIPQ